MRIDYTKPIMFDRDTNGGLGAGTWQINPQYRRHRSTEASAPVTRTGRIARRVLLIACLSGLAVGGICSIATQIIGYH